MQVYFHGRGDWFFNSDPNDKFGPRLAHNFVYQDPETGDVESTDEFFRLYDCISKKLCREFVGVFELSNKDTAIYLSSKTLDHVEKLLPCKHKYSGFFIALEECCYLKLSDNDLENCFFLIQKEIDMSCFEHNKISTASYIINNTLTVYNESDASYPIGENINEVSVIPENTKKEYETEIASMVRDAIKELIEIGHDKSLKKTNVAEYVLGDDFSHTNIMRKTNESAVRRRTIELSGSGKIIGFDAIYRSCRQTVMRN